MSDIKPIKDSWNEKSICLDHEAVTSRLWQHLGHAQGRPPEDLHTGAVTHGKVPMVSPLQMLDAIRALDEKIAREQETRSNMVKLLNVAMGQVVY